MRAAEIVSCIAFIQFLLGEASVIKYSRHRVFKDWTARPSCRFIVSVHNAGATEVKRENVNGEKTENGKRERRKGQARTRATSCPWSPRKPHKVRELAITRATRYTRHTGSARRKRDRHSDQQLPEAHSPVPIDITSCQMLRDKKGKMDCMHRTYRETPRNVITTLLDAEIP